MGKCSIKRIVKERLYWVNLSFACGGLIVRSGIIVDYAPIFKGWKYKRLSEFYKYYRNKKSLKELILISEKIF